MLVRYVTQAICLSTMQHCPAFNATDACPTQTTSHVHPPCNTVHRVTICPACTNGKWETLSMLAVQCACHALLVTDCLCLFHILQYRSKLLFHLTVTQIILVHSTVLSSRVFSSAITLDCHSEVYLFLQSSTNKSITNCDWQRTSASITLNCNCTLI